MKPPRLTVITPNLNRGRFLERTICSVLDQGYRNLEYLVIDGGSSDDSVRVIGYYERELAGWVSEPDTGPAEAINKALRRATGEYVAIVSGDDLLLPGALHEVSRFARTNCQADWIVGHCSVIGPHDQTTGALLASAPRSLWAYLMHDSGLLPLSSSFIRRDVIQELGAFDTTMRYGYDYEYTCRLLAARKTPWLLGQATCAKRQRMGASDARRTLRTGVEYVDAAWRYSHHLSWSERWVLWRNCDCRRKIFALAQAELDAASARRFLCQQLLRHPWWLADDTVRQVLRLGVSHPASAAATPLLPTPAPTRKAA